MPDRPTTAAPPVASAAVAAALSAVWALPVAWAGPPAVPGDALGGAAHGLEARGDTFAAERGYAAVGREAPTSYEGHLAWARFLIAQGRPEQALGPAGVANRLEPYAGAPYAVRGVAHLRAGQGEQGRAMLDKALEMEPWSADALLAGAGALREAGQAEAEAAVLARALDEAGDDLRVPEAAARSAMDRGDEAGAAKLIGRLAASGGGVEATLRVAETYLAAGRPSEALRTLQAALPQHPGHARLLRATGRALLGAGAPPERAAAAFRAALAADPDDADAAVGLVRALTAMLPDETLGAADLALRTLEALLQRSPGHVGALLARADLARALGDAAGAEAFLSRVPDTHPAAPEADNIRGLALLDREDPYGAARHFHAALARRPDLRHVRLNLALALVRAGRSADGRAEAAAAVQGLPEGHPLRAYAATLGVGT